MLDGARARWWRQPGIEDARAGGFDVVHLTDHALGHHSAGFAGKARVVVTCNDVMPFTLPGYHRTVRERVVKQAFLRRSLTGLRRTDQVIAVSEFTAREAIELLDLPPRLVTVVPNMRAAGVPADGEAGSREGAGGSGGGFADRSPCAERGARGAVQEPGVFDSRDGAAWVSVRPLWCESGGSRSISGRWPRTKESPNASCTRLA